MPICILNIRVALINMANQKLNKIINQSDNKLYYLLLLIFGLSMIQKIFFPILVLNEPLKAIFVLVFILTTITIFITRKKYLYLGLTIKDSFKSRFIVLGFNGFKYFIGFGLIFYFSILFCYKVTVYAMRNQSVNFYSLPITEVYQSSRSNPTIRFYLHNELNSISDHSFNTLLNTIKNRFNPQCKITIVCHKSLFETYVVDTYRVSRLD
jgi:hypothetical protein